MESPSKRRWVASVVLSSTLLVSSLPGNYGSVNASEPVGDSEPILLRNSSVLMAQAIPDLKSSSVSKIVNKEILLQPTELTPLVAESIAANPASRLGGELEPMEASSDSPSVVQQSPEVGNAKSITETKDVIVTASESIATKQSDQKTARQITEVSRGGISKGDEIVSNAKRLIGIPYLFGGTTTRGFDCSGFIKYVYKGSGIDMPRTSYEQYGVGNAVKKDQLQAGDLVFFSTYDSGASHVGIYVGSGSFIHASRSGIKITGLSDSYYASRYLGARRAF